MKKKVERQKKKRKILCISDLHIPFHKVDLISEVITEHDDADIVVVNGDMFDAYGISSFRKSQYIPLVTEYVLACELVEVLASIFPLVVLTHGNHEARWERQVLSKIPSEAVEFAKMGVLERIIHGDRYVEETEEWINIGRIENVRLSKRENGAPHFATMIGKTVFAHPEKHSKVPGKAAKDVMTFFADHKIDFDCLVIAHTHKASVTWYPHCMVLEQGCMKEKSLYSFSPKASYSPEVLGYAVIVQDEDGSVDINNTRVQYCGSNLHSLPDISQ